MLGIDFNLYVDQDTYESWRDLLKGLVMAKERDRQLWHKPARSQHRSSVRSSHAFSAAPATRSYSTRRRPTSHRARSTSPGETRSFTYAFEFTAPPYSSTSNQTLAPPPAEYSPTPKSGSKRQATTAFSPTSVSFADTRPSKRPSSMTLEIPELAPGRNSNSVSPLESLQSFSRMSLGSSPHVPFTPQSNHTSPAWISYASAAPQTLVTAYRADKPVGIPQVREIRDLASTITTNNIICLAESLLLFSCWIRNGERRDSQAQSQVAVSSAPSAILHHLLSAAAVDAIEYPIGLSKST